MAAAAANAAKVAALSKQHAAEAQPIGQAMATAGDHLLGLPLPGAQMLVWILVLFGIFAVLPFAISLTGRRRRKSELPEELPS